MSFVPLAECAKRIAQEPDLLLAEDALQEFLSAHPEAAEQVLYQEDGFWGMEWLDVEHLRVEYRIWKERQIAIKQSEIREKQSEAGRQTKNLKRGKTKAASASGKKSSKPRRKNA
jgi:hypothetical protein